MIGGLNLLQALSSIVNLRWRMGFGFGSWSWGLTQPGAHLTQLLFLSDRVDD